MSTGEVLSIQVGLPQHFGIPDAPAPMDRPWSTGIFKDPVTGPLWMGFTNLSGDGQADLTKHGGPEKAVLAYAASHYPDWQQRLARDLTYGAFGENLTVAGQTEQTVCIGDIYTLGEAVVQVSQPRQPCWKLSRRWRIKDLALQVQQLGQTGWYFRVLQEGFVAAGQSLALQERIHPEWSVSLANDVMHLRRQEPELLQTLAHCPALAPNWRERLQRRIQGIPSDTRPRLMGPNE